MEKKIHYASIIIDDPLLRENYGFLNFQKLLNLMDKHNFFTTIAFIPFNFNRTDKKIATLFRERQDRFGLCVHGCDHSKGEFGKTDCNYLDKKVRLATARMIEHEKRTGIPFDKIMVFPQGIFSNEALEVLKKNNYWAAINTEAIPVNGCISSDFPFFLRYNPDEVIDNFASPIFITLHHDFFKDGYGKIVDLIEILKARYKNIRWGSVGNIIRNYVTTCEIDDIGNIDLSGFKCNGFLNNLKIHLRRYASEYRDDHLCKNDSLLYYAERIKKKYFK